MVNEMVVKMANVRERLVPIIAATALLLGTAASVPPVSHAEEAVLIPGATVFKRINPIYPMVATTYPDIGIHFHTDESPQVIQYSQNALDSDRAIADGVRAAKAAVGQTDGKVVVIGESMGSMVAWRVATELANGDDPPDPDDIRFVLIAPPEAGIAEYFPKGTFIPVLNYRVTRIAESPYPTTVVIGEYDGWADPPDRPWNLAASANALLGVVYVHGPPIFTADPDGVPPENISTSPDGKVETIFVPTAKLPLTQPLRLLGVPEEVVDQADQALRPVIDAGYRRHDEPGDPRPYLSDGRILHNVQRQQQVREQRRERRIERTERRHQRSVIRSERRKQAKADLTGRMAHGIHQLKEKQAERKGERPE